MDKKQAQTLIKETFESTFDKGRFVGFVKNLLNDVEEATFMYKGNYIPDAYEQYINTLERIGKYTDGEHKIDILIAKLKKETSIERARTMQRNFVAWYLNGSRGGELKDAALVAFVAPNEEDWRFSLVKMDYRFEEGKKGRMRVKEEFTPARRWSFLVGVNENSHTAQSQLVNLVADDERNPALVQLEEAFNIEKVTREFFEKYRELFLWTQETLDGTVKKDKKIREDFESKGIDTVDFSKKLLGQIVFLYFLQKKGWFGVTRDADWGTGPKNFLRELFGGKHGTYKNFFNDILEPLFYEALARERDDDFYSRFNCKIPFLNGGLFDPINNYDWVHTDILLPDDLFSNGYKTKEGDKGNGILDIFDRYNFTVKEDEPLEKEVAVDPEMLGKVFENLLEVKDRKSKGTYYTPREIVHYMCVQSLLNYLATELEGKVSKEDCDKLIKYGESVGENEAWVEKKGEETQRYYYKLPESIRDNAKLIDDKLINIKVCDPAIGSGAFPVGMMTELVRIRKTLSSYIKGSGRSLYNFKWECIHNSLYGVDIDPSAVEIAKLRLWLSLVVDEEDIRQIKPLPNLDYKIMQGNSLLEEYEGVRLFDDKLISTVNLDKEKQISALKEKQAELSSEYIRLHQADKLTRDKKQQIDEELKKINIQIKRLEQSGKRVEENASLFDIYNTAKKKSDELKRFHKEFFETTQKTKKDELKKQIERLEWDLIETTLREQNKISELKKLDILRKANVKPFFLWKLHFTEVFQEKGGFDLVIANPPYVGQKGNNLLFKPIKNSSLGRFHQRRMDYFYFFFHLALDIGKKHSTTAFITTNYYPTATYADKLRADFKRRSVIRELINFNELKIFESALGQHNMLTILEKGEGLEEFAKVLSTNKQGIANSQTLHQILSGDDLETFTFNIKQKDLYDGQECYIRLTGSVSGQGDGLQKILNKIKNESILLGNICSVIQGIVTGADKISPKHIEKYKLNASVGDGIFVLSNQEVRQLSWDQREKKYLKPWFKNSDIFSWKTNEDYDEQLIYYTSKNCFDSDSSIKKHFEKYKTILINRNTRSGTGLLTIRDYDDFMKGRKYISYVMIASSFKSGKYYCISYARDQHIFDGPKIVVPQRSYSNTFGYNEIPWYASADVYFITQRDQSISLKYVLALLNSNLYYFWLYHRGKRKGESLELYQKPLSEIPIKKILKDEQKPFIDVVDKILSITKSDDYLTNSSKQAKAKAYESQIDQMVYELYGLTKEEIKTVEGSCKKD